MEKNDLVTRRLHNQRIVGKLFHEPEEIVRWMGAIQAQDYGQAVWGIGLRTKSATLAKVETAIAERKILRTWPMRGTIHFVLAEDARWMLSIGAERMLAAEQRRQNQLSLDTGLLDRSLRLFSDALHGDRRLNRPEMMDLLEKDGISTAGQRGYHILFYAAVVGLICIGPLQGKQQTFALLDEWAPNPRRLERDEALAELARRYFTSHGPATAKDFAWWAGLGVREARAAIAANPQLNAGKFEGYEYWFADQPAELPPLDTVHLLPGYDEYLLGYTGRRAVLEADHARQVVPGGNGVFYPVVLVDGQVVGVWKRSVMKDKVQISLSPFSGTALSEEGLQQAAQRYADFLSLRAVI